MDHDGFRTRRAGLLRGAVSASRRAGSGAVDRRTGDAVEWPRGYAARTDARFCRCSGLAVLVSCGDLSGVPFPHGPGTRGGFRGFLEGESREWGGLAQGTPPLG